MIRARVLVVDDEAAIRDLIAESLSQRANAYEVLTASDGSEAL